MTTSMKLANRTYPSLQELYFRLRKWTDANFSPITLDHQLPFLSKYRRKELYDRLFQSVTFILEQLHPGYQQIDGLPCAQPCRTLNILQPWSFNTFMNLNCCCNCLIQSNTSMMPTVITETFSQIHHNTLVYCLDGWKFGTRKRHFDGWCVVSQTKESGRELSFIE